MGLLTLFTYELVAKKRPFIYLGLLVAAAGCLLLANPTASNDRMAYGQALGLAGYLSLETLMGFLTVSMTISWFVIISGTFLRVATPTRVSGTFNAIMLFAVGAVVFSIDKAVMGLDKPVPGFPNIAGFAVIFAAVSIMAYGALSLDVAPMDQQKTA